MANNTIDITVPIERDSILEIGNYLMFKYIEGLNPNDQMDWFEIYLINRVLSLKSMDASVCKINIETCKLSSARDIIINNLFLVGINDEDITTVIDSTAYEYYEGKYSELMKKLTTAKHIASGYLLEYDI